MLIQSCGLIAHFALRTHDDRWNVATAISEVGDVAFIENNNHHRILKSRALDHRVDIGLQPVICRRELLQIGARRQSRRTIVRVIIQVRSDERIVGNLLLAMSVAKLSERTMLAACVELLITSEK